jgi:hypothetical protein
MTTAPAPSPEPAATQSAPAIATAPPAAPITPPAAPPPVSLAPSAAKSDRPAVSEAAKAPASAAPPQATKATAAPAAKPPGPPPLDLKSLETRLRETNAIGVYTKLTLKNQVDDLLDAFRAYYKGQAKSTLADLRRAYDLLVLKVIALLQDADPPLASAIATSREAIWGILSDPVKFATV